MSALVHCIYTSAATHDLGAEELTKILDHSREKNHGVGITGMLLYTQGCFFQVLEGRPEAVEHLYRQILADERNANVTKIIWEPISKRSFEEWTMGFCCMSPEELEEVIGANNFLCKDSETQGVLEGRARKLLLAFREGRWRVSLNTELYAVPA